MTNLVVTKAGAEAWSDQAWSPQMTVTAVAAVAWMDRYDPSIMLVTKAGAIVWSDQAYVPPPSSGRRQNALVIMSS